MLYSNLDSPTVNEDGNHGPHTLDWPDEVRPLQGNNYHFLCIVVLSIEPFSHALVRWRGENATPAQVHPDGVIPHMALRPVDLPYVQLHFTIVHTTLG